TGRTLEPGEVYYAALVDLPAEAGQPADALGIQRVDVSLEAWDEGYRPDHLFSYWKSTVPQPNEKKKLFVDDTVLMNLLVRLADAAVTQRIAFRYLLDMILMRKKLIRYVGSERRTAEVDGQPVEQERWRFTPKHD